MNGRSVGLSVAHTPDNTHGYILPTYPPIHFRTDAMDEKRGSAEGKYGPEEMSDQDGRGCVWWVGWRRGDGWGGSSEVLGWKYRYMCR